VPRDFDIIDVPFRERGAPQLRRGAAVGALEAEAEVDRVREDG
jgi:hypothetical protein